MSVDPWHEVKNEVQNSLEAATNLRASFLRISSTASANSEELNWARNELKGTLAALDADLEDLEESVRIVEETGGRLFGVEEEEVMARRKYVVYVRNQIETMRKEVNSSVPNTTSTSQSAYSPVVGSGPQEDDQAEWSRLEQEMEVQRQDSTLDTISGTLHTLAAQANLIGHEVGEHNEMLSELEANVDRSDSKLSSAMKKMKHFIRETEETKSAQPTLPEYQAFFRWRAQMMDAVRKTLVGATTPSFLGLTAGLAFIALSLRPAFVPLVFLLAALVNYTRAIIKRPHFKHRFFALLATLSVATVAAFSSSAESALSTRIFSSALLLLAAAVFSLIALAPILIYAWARSYVGSRSPLAGVLLFPALWTTTWSLLVWASPLGRIGAWTPMTGIETYTWVTTAFGQLGLDYITALWAVVIAEYAGEWLMGPGTEGLVPNNASPNIDLLTPIEDEDEDQNITSHANVSSTAYRTSPTPYLVGLLILSMVPSYWAPVLPLPTHAPNSTEVTVSCVHPYVARSGTPLLLEDYLTETVRQASRAKIVLWPEGAVQFRSDKERDAAFAKISLISGRQRVWIGATYEQTFSHSNETVMGKRVRGINALAIFGPDAKPVTYIKRRLVPLVESFSLESSADPPPRYPVTLPMPNSRPNKDRHSWPRTIPVTAAICLDVSAPLETSVPVDDLPGDLGRPALILAPARTWHPDVGKAMFQHASTRAIEQGASILWCDGGEGGVSGVGGLAAQGLGLLGGIGQVGGGGSWIQTIGIPFPYDAGSFGPTWYARWGDLSAIFFAWAVLTIGFAEPVVRGFGKLAGLIYYQLKRREGESQPNENAPLLFNP